MNKLVVFIAGPTSSGKTAVAERLALLKNGEIISCDSMQVYKDMDILTQSPFCESDPAVPYHLIRTIAPEEEFDVAKYIAEAEPVIENILSRSFLPIVTGGTGLYMKALLDGIFTSPQKRNEMRGRFDRIAREKGAEYLHAELRKVDPDTAEKLHPNDVRRVVRALEVFEVTGETIYKKKKEIRGIADFYE